MNITASILKKVKDSKSFPVIVTNEDFPIIQESSLIVQALEGDGYKVESFVDLKNSTYGFKIDER